MLQRHIREGAKHAVHNTMLAAAIDRYGGPEVLTIHALPVSVVGPREVLIALDTAGVGPWDLEIREGKIPSRKPHFPLVLGVDGAGIVMAVGSRVRRFKIGDWVYSYNWVNPKGGFYTTTYSASLWRRRARDRGASADRADRLAGHRRPSESERFPLADVPRRTSTSPPATYSARRY